MTNNYSTMFKNKRQPSNEEVVKTPHPEFERDVNGYKEIVSNIIAPDKVTQYKTAEVIVKFLNARCGPVKTASKIAVLRKGDKVTVLNMENEWCYIQLQDKTKAYIMTKHII